MKEILILSSARKAILARLFSLGRHFCDDDVNEMVSMTVERFYSCGSYDPSKASVQTYVSRIARNVIYEFVKASDRALRLLLLWSHLPLVCRNRCRLGAGPSRQNRRVPRMRN